MVSDSDGLQPNSHDSCSSDSSPVSNATPRYAFRQILQTLRSDGEAQNQTVRAIQLVDWLGKGPEPRRLPSCATSSKVHR